MNRTLLLVAAIVIAVVTAAGPAPAQQAPVYGQWLTENRRGVIEFFPCADKLCGKLVWMIEPVRDGKPAIDDQNPKRELRQQPLCGLTLLGDFRETEPRHWEDGWIYNPDNGKRYHATITLESENQLRLRGYIGIPLFGESQHWTRADGSLGHC
jgi:uncharacterized protein (DUF2147 family)